MYFEFILKVRDSEHSPFITKYRCMAPKHLFDWVKAKYQREENKNPRNSVLLINEFDEHGEFCGVIQ